MKQAEHPPVTAGANSAAEYSLALIDQLARIDRTCSKEEMDELVCRLLSLIGEAMLSDRVFLFERLEGTAEAYCNTFEWWRERRRAADRQPDGDRSRGYAVLAGGLRPRRDDRHSQY